jgi:hypothetical protein
MFQDRVRRVPERPRVLRDVAEDGPERGQTARDGGNVSEAKAGADVVAF